MASLRAKGGLEETAQTGSKGGLPDTKAKAKHNRCYPLDRFESYSVLAMALAFTRP